MKKHIDRNEKLDRIGRELIRQVHFEGRLDEKIFLDRFHRKLHSIETELPDMSLSAWCWRMSPVTCVVSLVLMAILSVQGPMQPTVPDDSTEWVLSLFSADNGGVEFIMEELLHVEETNQ